MVFYKLFFKYLFLDKAKNRRAFQKWKKGKFIKIYIFLLFGRTVSMYLFILTVKKTV